VKNDVFCKDLVMATSARCRMIRESTGGGSSAETSRRPRVKDEYINHIAKKDIIREEEEFHEGLITEVEELKRIIGDTEDRFQRLQKSHKQKQHYAKANVIERKLMRLSEIEREREIAISVNSKIEKAECNYKAKYTLLYVSTKKLEQNLKELKQELEKKNSQLNICDLEKYRLNSDIAYLKQENQSLRSEISGLTQQYLYIPSKNPSVIPKSTTSASSTKLFCKSTIPKIRVTSKDSLMVSPISNASLPTVTQLTKRRESTEKDNSRLHRAGQPIKSKALSEKPLRSRKKIL
jgi:chromosome segregation ATPase